MENVNVIGFTFTKTGESALVKIIAPTEGSTIYYTLDGSTPSRVSNEYIGSFEVFKSTTIKAIAVKDGLLDSDVVTLDVILKVETPEIEAE